MEPRQVYVWGFAPGDLRLWPPDLQPTPITTLPTDSPVVVQAAAAGSFTQLMEAEWPPR